MNRQADATHTSFDRRRVMLHRWSCNGCLKTSISPVMIPFSAAARQLAGRRASACRYEIKCHAATAAASSGRSPTSKPGRRLPEMWRRPGELCDRVTAQVHEVIKSATFLPVSRRRTQTKREMQDAQQRNDGKTQGVAREVLKEKLSETN